MRRLLQRLLKNPVIRLANKLSSRPDKKRIDAALSELHENILSDPGKKGRVISFDNHHDKFIILSDQHKGARDGSDIFATAEKNYLSALDYYYSNQFFYINLGDSEELWENLFVTIKKHNKNTFEKERLFLDDDRFVKIFGNHDLYWDNDPLAAIGLMQLYGKAVRIYEGIVLQTTIDSKVLSVFMTHGHQGDLQSDGNWFSKWFVSNIWAPFEAFLQVNPNTPAYNNELKTDHNSMMYNWSAAQHNMVLVTGHTHQPVFKSMTQLEIIYSQLDEAKKANDRQKVNELQEKIMKLHLKGNKQPDFSGYLDSYFNSGCCCFDDGDITGIEIADGYIRLVKWEYDNQDNSVRQVLEESRLEDLKLKEG